MRTEIFCVFLCSLLIGEAIQSPKVSIGEPAKPKEWPFYASLRETANNVHFCGGTLVKKQWVITSANCIKGHENLSSWKIDLGRFEAGEQKGIQHMGVDKVMVHPEYKDTSLDNNIALVHLEKPADLNTEFVKTCRIVTESGQSKELVKDLSCAVAGWTKTANSKDFLHVINVVLTDSKTCKAAFPPPTSSIFCAKSVNSADCSNPWDEGGPIICVMSSDSKKAMTQAGFLIFGGYCNDNKTQVVYTDMTQLASWYMPIINMGESLRFQFCFTLLIYYFIIF